MRIDRIVVAHQYDRCCLIGLAELCRHRECFVERHARLKSALPSQLDGWSICHRIGEGQAQFDNIYACRGHAFHHLKGGGNIGITRHDVGHEGFFIFGLKGGECGVDAAHGAFLFMLRQMCPKSSGEINRKWFPNLLCSLGGREGGPLDANSAVLLFSQGRLG